MAVDESQDLLDQVAGEKPAAEAPPQAPQQAPQQAPPGGDLLDEVNTENKKNSGTLGKISETTKSWRDFANEGIFANLPPPGLAPGVTVGNVASAAEELLRKISEHESTSAHP